MAGAAKKAGPPATPRCQAGILRARAAVAQLVEHQLPKLRVASSNLVRRFLKPAWLRAFCVPGRVGQVGTRVAVKLRSSRWLLRTGRAWVYGTEVGSLSGALQDSRKRGGPVVLGHSPLARMHSWVNEWVKSRSQKRPPAHFPQRLANRVGGADRPEIASATLLDLAALCS